MSTSPDFDPEYASTSGWAREYRCHGIQVVPSKPPHPKREWKIPDLLSWKEFQNNLIPQSLFDEWYGPNGEYARHTNMGIITGAASGYIFMLDLDTYKSPAALTWWLGVLAVHNGGSELETWEQITGGGGKQMFFRYPENRKIGNARTRLNIDIRAQGGFAVLPPSLHTSGNHYEWVSGREPWNLDICVAPPWLMAEVDRLIVEHGGGHAGAGTGGGPDDTAEFTPFGIRRTNGRDAYMRDLIWAAMTGYRLKSAVAPGGNEKEAVWTDYERNAAPKAPIPGELNADGLERERRGRTLFEKKWAYAIAQWNDDVVTAARARDEKGGGPGTTAGGGEGSRDYSSEFAKEEKIDPDTGQPLPLILTAEQFLRGFRPPDYLVDGMLQRSYLISLTARTGHGKTAVAMLLGQAVARGVMFHGKPVEQGGVLFLAGENPDDIRARYLILAAHEGFDPYGIPFRFVDGVINIQTSLPKIREEAALVPNLSLIIVDTQAAYFLGDEGNSNEQQGWFARLLRELIKLPGKPAVLVNCHPVKNAAQDNLIPMGGSAFLNEVDANLTLWAEDKTCVLGPHPDKWRGVSFESIAFELRTATCDRLKDTKGRCIPSVIAVPITEMGAERRAAVAEEDENSVLRLIHADKRASFSSIARAAGFFVPDGSPAKAKVQRIVERLKVSKLIYKFRGNKYRLTKKGCKAIGVKFESGEDDDE